MTSVIIFCGNWLAILDAYITIADAMNLYRNTFDICNNDTKIPNRSSEGIFDSKFRFTVAMTG